jgi:hypothetical protein
VYGKPYRGKCVVLNCQASGIVHRKSNADDAPSVDLTPIKEPVAKQVLKEDMAVRERLAQAEAERRKKMIAPMYNKGAYQYIGGVTPEILHDIGKKK